MKISQLWNQSLHATRQFPELPTGLNFSTWSADSEREAVRYFVTTARTQYADYVDRPPLAIRMSLYAMMSEHGIESPETLEYFEGLIVKHCEDHEEMGFFHPIYSTIQPTEPNPEVFPRFKPFVVDGTEQYMPFPYQGQIGVLFRGLRQEEIEWTSELKAGIVEGLKSGFFIFCADEEQYRELFVDASEWERDETYEVTQGINALKARFGFDADVAEINQWVTRYNKGGLEAIRQHDETMMPDDLKEVPDGYEGDKPPDCDRK